MLLNSLFDGMYALLTLQGDGKMAKLWSSSQGSGSRAYARRSTLAPTGSALNWLRRVCATEATIVERDGVTISPVSTECRRPPGSASTCSTHQPGALHSDSARGCGMLPDIVRSLGDHDFRVNELRCGNILKVAVGGLRVESSAMPFDPDYLQVPGCPFFTIRLDVPAGHGERVQAAVGRRQLLPGHARLSALFPGLAVTFIFLYRHRHGQCLSPTIVRMFARRSRHLSAIMMWYVPYMFKRPTEKTQNACIATMYAGTTVFSPWQ